MVNLIPFIRKQVSQSNSWLRLEKRMHGCQESQHLETPLGSLVPLVTKTAHFLQNEGRSPWGNIFFVSACSCPNLADNVWALPAHIMFVLTCVCMYAFCTCDVRHSQSQSLLVRAMPWNRPLLGLSICLLLKAGNYLWCNNLCHKCRVQPHQSLQTHHMKKVLCDLKIPQNNEENVQFTQMPSCSALCYFLVIWQEIRLVSCNLIGRRCHQIALSMLWVLCSLQFHRWPATRHKRSWHLWNWSSAVNYREQVFIYEA